MRVWAGRSTSEPERVRERVCPSATAWSGMVAKVGAALTSVTVTEKEREVAVTPSETATVTAWEPGPWASVGSR